MPCCAAPATWPTEAARPGAGGVKATLVAVGRRMPDWVNAAFDEYRRRLRPPVSLELVEVEARRRGRNADVARIIEDEGAAVLAAVPGGALPVALDRGGRDVDTRELAGLLQGWVDDAQDVAFLVGGPEGLSAPCLSASRLTLSLSRLTFAHPLVRVVLAEQLYRAFSINHGLPYHR